MWESSADCVAGSERFGLPGERHVGAIDDGAQRFGGRPDGQDDLTGRDISRSTYDMLGHWQSRDPVKDLWRMGTHPGSTPGCEDDDGNIAVACHTAGLAVGRFADWAGTIRVQASLSPRLQYGSGFLHEARHAP